jgi:hypothetical protein
MPSSVAEAGYELSQNAISEQSERLGELRGRTGTLLAAASLAASFLGGQTIRAGDLGVLGGLALVAYLVCVGACIKVLLPHRLVFAFRGSALIDAARQSRTDLEEALEAATGWFESFLEENRAELERLTRWYTVACLALGAEIVLWLLGAPDILG